MQEMTEKEKTQVSQTEKKNERVFVLGIGRGPKMRTLEFVFTPVEKATNKDEEENTPQKEENAEKKDEAEKADPITAIEETTE